MSTRCVHFIHFYTYCLFHLSFNFCFVFFTIMRHNKFLIFMSDNDTFNAFNARHTACILKKICVYNVASINVTATHHLNSSHVIYQISRL